VPINLSSNSSIKIYYYNSSYDFNSNILTNINVVEIGQYTNTSFNHSHNSGTYGHIVVPLNINVSSGKIGSVYLSGGGFLIARVSGSPKLSTLNNSVRSNSGRYSNNKGVTWTSGITTNTLASHIHQYYGNEKLIYSSCGYWNGVQNCSALRTDIIDFPAVPPTPASLIIPFGETTYNQYMNITWIPAIPISNGTTISLYNITLVDENLTELYVLNTTTSLLNYYWNIFNYNLSTGRDYYIKLYSKASNNGTSFDRELFQIIHNAQLNITAYDSYTNGSITGLSVNITDTTSSSTETLSTSGTTITANITKGHSYSIIFDQGAYEILTKNITANTSIYQTLNQSLSKTNSVTINVYDETTLARLTNVTAGGSINITFTSNTTSFSNSTNT